MAVKLITRFERYIGVAADTKPTSGVPIGSKFLETDTDKVFIFDGTSWAEITGLSF